MSAAMTQVNALRAAIDRCNDPAERRRLNDDLLRAMVGAADLRVGDVSAPLVNRGPLQSGFGGGRWGGR